jgi:hypothetical protein
VRVNPAKSMAEDGARGEATIIAEFDEEIPD